MRRQNEKNSHQKESKNQKDKETVLTKPAASAFKSIFPVSAHRLVIDQVGHVSRQFPGARVPSVAALGHSFQTNCFGRLADMGVQLSRAARVRRIFRRWITGARRLGSE